jgi:hypothetical protein
VFLSKLIKKCQVIINVYARSSLPNGCIKKWGFMQPLIQLNVSKGKKTLSYRNAPDCGTRTSYFFFCLLTKPRIIGRCQISSSCSDSLLVTWMFALQLSRLSLGINEMFGFQKLTNVCWSGNIQKWRLPSSRTIDYVQGPSLHHYY